MNRPDNSTNPNETNLITAETNHNETIEPAPNQQPKDEFKSNRSDDEIDLDNFAGFDPHLPLTLEAQYQLQKENEKPEPLPVAQRGVPRAVTMLILTGGTILLFLLIWQFVKPRSAIKPIAQTTPKETKESPIKDEKPELLARLAYVDQQKLVAQNPKAEKQPQTEPEAKSTPPQVVERSTPRPAPAKSPTPPPRTIVRTVTVPAPPSLPKTIVRTVTVPGPPPPPKVIVRTVTVPAPVPKPAPVSTPEPTPKPIATPAPTTEKVDPFKRWNQLAQLGQTRGNVESDSSAGLQNASTPNGADTPGSEAPLISEIQVSSKPTGKEQASNSILTNNTAVPVTIDDRLPSDTAMRSHLDSSQGELSAARVTPQPSINRLGHIADESALSGSLPTSSDRTSEFLTVAIGNSPQNQQPARTNLSPGAIGILTRTPQSPKPTETAQVTLGTTVSGTVSVPLLWDEDTQEQLYNRFAITLTEDILATDGSAVLKAGTVIIAKASRVGKENRMVQARAIAVVYTDESGQVKQQEIPNGAISIAGENGEPLIAKGYLDPGDDIVRQDLLIALLSGAGRVGEVLTSPRARSRSTVSSGGFSSDTITVESRNPQIWSAVLDGFFTPLAKRLEKRSDKAVEELLNRPNIAMLPKGTKVSLVLNSFLNINR